MSTSTTVGNRSPFVTMHAPIPDVSTKAPSNGFSILYVSSGRHATSPYLLRPTGLPHFNATGVNLEHLFISLMVAVAFRNLMSVLNGMATHNPSQSSAFTQKFSAPGGTPAASTYSAPPTDATPRSESAPSYRAPPKYAPPNTSGHSVPPTHSAPPTPQNAGKAPPETRNDVPQEPPETWAGDESPMTLDGARHLFDLPSNHQVDRDQIEILYANQKEKFAPENIAKRNGIRDSAQVSSLLRNEMIRGEKKMREVDAARQVLLDECAANESKPKAQSVPVKPQVSKTERNNALDALGLPRGSQPTVDQVNAAFKRMSLKHHPDRNMSKPASEQEAAAAMFKEAAAARDILLGMIG